MPPGRTRTSPEWISLGEASRTLGIAPGTLRRWADEGRIRVFTTPGGHRRFSRSGLRALLPADRLHRPPLARLGLSPDRLATAYRSAYRARHPTGQMPESQTAYPWLAALSDEQRITFRDRGRQLVRLLLEHLDAEDPDVAALRLQEASRNAAETGRDAAALGASMTEAVQGFLEFRSPFLAELVRIARRRGLDTGEATSLLTDADAAMDRLLVAMMTGHSLASGPRQPRVRRARTLPAPEQA